MNDHYGVDPGAAATIEELTNLLRHFGPQHGRFIVEFPGEWYAEVKRHFGAARDVERSKLLELWRRHASAALLPTGVRYRAQLTWHENAAYLLAAQDAQELIGPEDARPPCKPLSTVLLDPSALPDARGAHIPRTPQAYVSAAIPLLQISPKVVMVDPHFRLRYRAAGGGSPRPSHRHRRSLQALLRAAAQQRRVEVFCLMVSKAEVLLDAGDEKVLKEDLRSVQEAADAREIDVRHEFLDPGHPLERHPRYLLGKECGIRFDWGFDIADDSSSNHVEWVGAKALQPLLDRFM